MKNNYIIFFTSIAANIVLLYQLRKSVTSNAPYAQLFSNIPSSASAILTDNKKSAESISKIVIFRSSYGNNKYAPARDSVDCYAKIYNYQLIDVNLDTDQFTTACAEFPDRNFRRHCILAQYLLRSNATHALALDGDVAVINPNHKIEKFIDFSASLIFYERFRTLEIAACSFIVKNDAYGIEFLMSWARYNQKLPPVSWSNSDNGALLSLLLEKRSVARHEQSLCTNLWIKCNTANDYIKYMHCVFVFLGARRNNVTENIKILRRGHSWARDQNTADGHWCEVDIFFHSLKLDNYNTNSNDNPFSQPINTSDCKFGAASTSFNMKPQLKISCEELRQKMRKKLVIPETQPVPYLNDNDIECWPQCD